MTAQPFQAYAGVDNLEVMAEAVNYNAFLLALVAAEARRGDELLDFGAGAGMLALPLAAAGHRVICVEPDGDLRSRLSGAGLDAYGGVEPIEPESVDFAYTVNVLEHIEDDAGAVARLRDRLKPHGKLLVYVPAFPLLFSTMDRKVGHVRRYRRTGLVELLERGGFTIEGVAYQDCVGFLASLLFKLVGSRDGTINRRALVAYDRWVFPLSHWLDRIFGRWFGKNLVALARRNG